MRIATILPQTFYQIWGLALNPKTEVFQFEYPIKHIRAPELTEAIYDLNTKIAALAGINNLRFVSLTDRITLDNCIYDEQLLNLKNYFPNLKILGKRDIIHYTSNPNRVIEVSDAKYGVDFLRQLYRNLIYFQKVKPSVIYSVIYPWNRSTEKRKNLLWKNCKIDSKKIERKSVNFLNTYKSNYPELNYLSKQHDPTILSPRYRLELDSFIEWVEYNYDSLKNTNKQIFIKHHRGADFIYPDSFKVRDINFQTLNSPLMRVLPLEILLHSIKSLEVITTPSSLAAFGERVRLIRPFTEVDLKDYGLLHKKLLNKNSLLFFGTSSS